jgi:hypothetical protein
MADEPAQKEVTLEEFDAMTDAEKDALPKSQRKKLDKRSKAEIRKAENAAKEAARLAAAAEARAAKEAGGASAAVEKQGELDALRAARIATPVSEELKHPYSSRTLIKSLLRAPEEGKSLIGKIVDVGGWVRSVRANGPMFFVTLNDGSCHANLQVRACFRRECGCE